MKDIVFYKKNNSDELVSFAGLFSDTPVMEKQKILQYLKAAPVIAISPEITRDSITDERIPGSSLMYCDGVYVWSSDIIYHFEKYNLELTQEFVDHALRGRTVSEDKVRALWREYREAV